MRIIESPNSAIQLRNARPEEIEEVSSLLVAAFQEYAKYMPSNMWNAYRNDIKDISSRILDSELIVSDVSDHIAGTVTFYPKGSKDGWPEGWAGIRLLGVHPDFRGRGIGRALMEESIRRCQKLGIMTIGLHTSVLMKVARVMYEDLGFKRAPELDIHLVPGNIVLAYRLDL
jgi:GNAT superfamily N-acetyltransferase